MRKLDNVSALIHDYKMTYTPKVINKVNDESWRDNSVKR